MPKKNYTPEFKLDAVRMLIEYGHSVSEVMRKLGVFENQPYAWRNQAFASGRVTSILAQTLFTFVTEDQSLPITMSTSGASPR